jgi:altronate dehydratase large subunit
MDNTNPTTENIAKAVCGTIPLCTPFGRTQIGHDFEMTLKTLSAIGCHPNIAAVLVLSLSLESARRLAGLIEPSGKPVETLGLQECGGTTALLAEGIRSAARLVLEASELNREACSFSDLIIGVECGGSDTTSGIVSNPATGMFADRFIDEGGTIILSEPAEFMGAEHLLAARAVKEGDRKRIIEMVKWFEDEAKRAGVDMRGINPTPDNISGGLSTLEEKSLGAIVKGGTRPVGEIIEYADSPSRKGLIIMNTPSAACESMTGLVGGGAQIIVFSTGRGNSIGAPVAPTLKITGNPNTAKRMPENIDLDLSDVITRRVPLENAAERLWQRLLKVASGKYTCCEILHEQQLSVSRFGPSV